MKADLRISIKDYRRKKTLRIILHWEPFLPHRLRVKLNGSAWPKDGRPVSVTRLLTSLRKTLVQSLKATHGNKPQAVDRLATPPEK